jgi:hemolysin activation/secretion protein
VISLSQFGAASALADAKIVAAMPHKMAWKQADILIFMSARLMVLAKHRGATILARACRGESGRIIIVHGRFRFTFLFTVLLLSLSGDGALQAAERTPEQDLVDRLQEEQRRRDERRQQDVYLPATPALEGLNLPDTAGPCVTIKSIRFDWLGEPVMTLRGYLDALIAEVRGQCLGVAAVQELHRALNAALTAEGYVTSRVLIPEQDLADGELVFMLMAGRVESVTTEGLSPRQVRLALPVRKGRLLNLRDLEQAVENLGRVRGLESSFDIRPGSANGASVLALSGRQGPRLGGALILNEKLYGSTAQGSALANLEVGSPFGLTDRLVVSANTDLHRTVSDQAWGAGLDYDLGIGYWQLSAGFSRQAYLNRVQGVLQRFDATGGTDTTRLEAGRVLYRSSFSRVGLAGLFSYSDVGNAIEGATLQVSSYQLSSWGVRLDGEHRWQRWQTGAGLTAEYSTGHGPATALAGGGAIADVHNHRLLLTASALYPLTWQRGTVRFRLDSQHSDNHLFPLQRWSLASRVKGYDDISVTGNSGHLVSAEYAISPASAGGRLLWRPFVQVETGWIPAISNESGFDRLMGLTTGTDLSWKRLRTGLQISVPVDRTSTRDSANSHVVRGSMTLSW